MKISYYPGCTLKNNAKNFEDSTLCSLKYLGVEVEELLKWNCCGTVFSFATDDLIHHVAPIRNLIRVKESNSDKVMTLCAMCYNTLKRANNRVKNDPESLEKINNFMDREEVEYTRPKEIGFDDLENPVVLENLMAALGAEPIDFPYKTECCGAYQTVDKPEIVADRNYQILTSAQEQGAEVMAVSCPLCAFNLDHRQKETLRKYPEFKNIPILYFTQLIAIALGCPEEALRFDLHYVDPKPILKEKGLI